MVSGAAWPGAAVTRAYELSLARIGLEMDPKLGRACARDGCGFGWSRRRDTALDAARAIGLCWQKQRNFAQTAKRMAHRLADWLAYWLAHRQSH